PTELIESSRTWLTRIFAVKGDSSSPKLLGLDTFVIGCSLWVIVVSILLAVFVYERHPHIPDEVSDLYHARYFPNGLLAMPARPVRAASDIALFTSESERWYSPTPPGWPAMLALGSRFGVAWLVNPVLAGINVILAALLVEGLYNKRTARIVCALLCLSP